MPRVLEPTDMDAVEQQAEEVATAEEIAAEERRFMRTPQEQIGDLTDGGTVHGARLYPTRDGIAQLHGRAAAIRAWRWDGAETVLPLAWNPQGTRNDGGRAYFLKRYCTCCGYAGFKTRYCPTCVRTHCTNCNGSTEPKKIIRAFYRHKEDVPFPQRFYGDINCIIAGCPRRDGRGFKTEQDMRVHAMSKHRMEYRAYLEVEAAKRSDEVEELRRELAEVRAVALKRPPSIRGNRRSGKKMTSPPAT